MSIHISVAVWKFSKHSGTHLLVMLALADQANEEGWSYPAKSTIARRCRLSKRQTDRVIADLAKSGELTIVPRYKNGSSESNYYRITVSPPVADDSTPLSSMTVPPRHPRQYPPVADDSTPLSSMTAKTSLETSLKREIEPSGADAPNAPDPLDEIFKNTKTTYRKDAR